MSIVQNQVSACAKREVDNHPCESNVTRMASIKDWKAIVQASLSAGVN